MCHNPNDQGMRISFLPRAKASIVLIACCWLAMFAVTGFAQSPVETTLQQLGKETAKGYAQPLADLVSANLNSAFYSTAAIPYLGLHIRLDILAAGGIVTEEMKNYAAPLPANFPSQTFRTATIVGGTGATYVHPNDSTLVYKGSDGIVRATIVPLAIPQLTIGALIGTELSIRFLPLKVPGESDLPKTEVLSLGIRHSMSSYLPVIPLDVAVGFMYTRFKAEEFIDYRGSLLVLHGSKTFKLFTLYGGIGWEYGTMKARYENQTTATMIEIELKAKNTLRLTAGGKFSLGFFSVFGDVNVSQVSTFSGGIGFEI